MQGGPGSALPSPEQVALNSLKPSLATVTETVPTKKRNLSKGAGHSWTAGPEWWAEGATWPLVLTLTARGTIPADGQQAGIHTPIPAREEAPQDVSKDPRRPQCQEELLGCHEAEGPLEQGAVL